MRSTVMFAAVVVLCGLAVPALAMVPPCMGGGCCPCGPVCAPACGGVDACGPAACGPRMGCGKCKGSCCGRIWDGYCEGRDCPRPGCRPMLSGCAAPAACRPAPACGRPCRGLGDWFGCGRVESSCGESGCGGFPGVLGLGHSAPSRATPAAAAPAPSATTQKTY